MINFLFHNTERLVFRTFLASIFFLHYELAFLPGSLHGLLLIFGSFLLLARKISSVNGDDHGKLEIDSFLAYLLLIIVVISFFVSLIGMNEIKEPILGEQWLNLRAYILMPLAFIYVKYVMTHGDLKFLFEVCKWFIVFNSILMILQLVTGQFYVAASLASWDIPAIIPSGFSDGPTKNGMLIIYAMSIIIGCLITGQNKGYFINILAIVLGFGTLVLAASRAAFFGIFAVIIFAGLIYLYLRAQSKRSSFFSFFMISTVIVMITLATLFVSNSDGFGEFLEAVGEQDSTVNAVGHKATNIVDSSLLERFDIWSEFISRLGDNILLTTSFGHGPGYSIAINEGMNIHNSYLELLYQLGVVGLFLFLGILFFVLRRAFSSKQLILVPIFLALISIMVFMMAHDVVRGRLYWTALGILASGLLMKPSISRKA